MPTVMNDVETRGTLVTAARILSDLGLVQGHGHLSSRLDDGTVVCTPRAAPSLASAADMIRFHLDNWQQQDRLPVEIVMHTTIYEAHPDAGAIVRVHSSLIDAIGARLREVPIVHGRGSHLRGSPRVFDDPSPISTPERATRVADLLTECRAVVLRGNGAVIVGHDLPDAVSNASYLLETVNIHLGGGLPEPARPFTAEELALRGSGLEKDSSSRTWNYLVSMTHS